MTHGDFTYEIDHPTLAAVAEAARLLERWALATGVRFEQRRELLLVFDELATNVAKHATGATRLAIRARRSAPASTEIELEDDGVAYDPFARPEPDTTLPLALREPGGLGIQIVRRLAARVEYRYVDGRNRTGVVLGR
ncbi:MAG TPA: ATP-binding protein [Thermoanaerobaculia bacterium]|nr:ATP-binding protein [Thermoanaerobaculia bacterium]